MNSHDSKDEFRRQLLKHTHMEEEKGKKRNGERGKDGVNA